MRTPVPRDFTIKAVLSARFDRACVPGERLPPEATLCREFGVGRVGGWDETGPAATASDQDRSGS